MAYLTVTTQADVVDPGDGKLSLREAVAQANASAGFDTIRFTAAVAGHTLVLTGGELKLTGSVTIDGGGGAQTTIDADHASRVLSITGNGTKAELVDLDITNGRTGGQPGGGIALTGGAALTLTDSRVSWNDSTEPGNDGKGGAGGGIYAGPQSTLTVRNSTIIGNSAALYYGGGNGAGIAAASNSRITIADSTISNNTGEYGGGIDIGSGGSATIERTTITGNNAAGFRYKGGGGGLHIIGGTATVAASTISHNFGYGSGGGGILAVSSTLHVHDTTIAYNGTGKHYGPVAGGGVSFSGTASFVNCTITSNRIPDATGYDYGRGSGIAAGGALTLANTIVAGNVEAHGSGGIADDVAGTVTLSNGHNLFGSKVAGSVPGDRENVPPGAVFATLAPIGGGKLDRKGAVPLKDVVTNPALSAADPPAASDFDQLGVMRPQPAGSLPDIGAAELKQKLSTKPTANNDVLAGTNAGNTIKGLAGADLIRSLGGKDVVDGGDGSDFLDGGPGNDTITGGTGVDLVTYAGNVPVTVDLSAGKPTARRGSETDTLAAIEGVLGSDAADTFKGDAQNNEFQGKQGKDTATGGGGRDTYFIKAVADSPAGAGRDVIKDFAPGQDVLDLGNIDADTALPGRQSFRWVGKAKLTGAAQLGYYVSGNTTIVRASTDADAKPEVEIELTGQKTLTAADFRY